MSLPIQDTSHDLPDFEMRDEIRYCQYCETETPHRVGVYSQHHETDRYIYDREDEYLHCQCGNTATHNIKKTVTKKDISA